MFTGHENHEVSFSEGAAITKAWRDAHPNTRKGGYFSRDAIQELLDQEHCVGIRIYYGKNDDEEMELVIVGVTEDENDQIGEAYVCLDCCYPCPPGCGDANILNSDV